MDINAEPANDEHPEANGEEVEAATSIQASEKQRALFRPVIIQSAAVLEAVKARPGNVGVCLYGGATADLDSFCALPAFEIYGRGGRKPAARSNKRPPPENLWVVLGCFNLGLPFVFVVEAVGMWATLLRCPHAHSLRTYWPPVLRSLRKRKNFRQVESKERC